MSLSDARRQCNNHTPLDNGATHRVGALLREHCLEAIH